MAIMKLHIKYFSSNQKRLEYIKANNIEAKDIFNTFEDFYQSNKISCKRFALTYFVEKGTVPEKSSAAPFEKFDDLE